MGAQAGPHRVPEPSGHTRLPVTTIAVLLARVVSALVDHGWLHTAAVAHGEVDAGARLCGVSAFSVVAAPLLGLRPTARTARSAFPTGQHAAIGLTHTVSSRPGHIGDTLTGPGAAVPVSGAFVTGGIGAHDPALPHHSTRGGTTGAHLSTGEGTADSTTGAHRSTTGAHRSTSGGTTGAHRSTGGGTTSGGTTGGGTTGAHRSTGGGTTSGGTTGVHLAATRGAACAHLAACGRTPGAHLAACGRASHGALAAGRAAGPHHTTGGHITTAAVLAAVVVTRRQADEGQDTHQHKEFSHGLPTVLLGRAAVAAAGQTIA